MKEVFGPRVSKRGFTLTELFVVITMVAILVTLSLPARSSTRFRDRQVQCLNNCKQLASAWHLYATDYGHYPPNPDDPGNGITYHHWVPNAAAASGSSVFNPDPYYDGRNCLVAQYLGGNIAIFHCPADLRTGLYSGTQNPALIGKIIPAVRTVSASGAVGTVCDGFWNCGAHDNTPPRHPVNGPWLDGTHSACRGNGVYATFGKPSDFTVISPSMVFMIADENPDSINDGALGTVAALNNLQYIDWPASLHNGACTFSFCDGHAEAHKWLGNILQGPFIGSRITPIDAANRADLVWLANHSSTLK